MNKFEIERFELLSNIKTDVARQRSWIRNCLNEHSLERYIMAVLSNENLIREFYDESCLLLDKEFNTTLPLLVSGLQSILFAINIDNASFNMSPKIVQLPSKAHLPAQSANQTAPDSSEPIKISLKSKSSTSFGGNSLENAETTLVKIKRSNKIKKNNVVVFDIEDDAEEEMNDQGIELSTSVKINNAYLNEDANSLARSQSQSEITGLRDVHDQVGILTNPIKYTKNSQQSKIAFLLVFMYMIKIRFLINPC